MRTDKSYKRGIIKMAKRMGNGRPGMKMENSKIKAVSNRVKCMESGKDLSPKTD